jgi:translocation and assembly module TamB
MDCAYAEIGANCLPGEVSRVTKHFRPLTRIVIALVAFVVVSGLAVLLVLRSGRFHSYLRERLVSYIEESTGGRTDLDSLTFDWSTLTLTARGLTIHGTEPLGRAPLFRAPLMVLRLSLFSFGRAIDLTYLGIDHPELSVVVFSNGQTNLPTPRAPKSSGLDADVSTVIRLAVHRFDISAGSFQLADHTIPLNIHGSDFRSEIAYNGVAQEYQGEVSLSVAAQDRSALNAHLAIPLILGRDGIRFTDVRFHTPGSSLLATVSIDHLDSPRIAAQVSSHVSLEEARDFAGLPLHLDRTSPRTLDIDATLNTTRGGLVIQQASAALGATRLDIAGTGTTQASFHGSISLTQLNRLAGFSGSPVGSVDYSGVANLTLPDYSVTGQLAGRDVAWQRLRRVGFSAALQASPGFAQLSRIRLTALEASLTGDVALQDFKVLAANLQLQDLSIARAEEWVTGKPLGYAGVVDAKLRASGAMGAPDVGADFVVRPAPGGVPVSGELKANYTSGARVITISNSTFRLPHSSLTLAGEPGREALVTFVSRNLADLTPGLKAFSSSQPLSLAGGVAKMSVREQGPLDNPRLSGSVQLTSFTVDGRRFDLLSSAFEASQRNLSISGGTLNRGSSQATFSASIGLDRWEAQSDDPIVLNANVQRGRLEDFMTLARESSIPAAGDFTAAVQLGGTVANPKGTVNLTVLNGHLSRDSFERVELAATLSDRLIKVDRLDVSAPAGQLQASAEFTHPTTDLESGTLRAQVHTSSVDLSKIETLQSLRPGFAGAVDLHSEVVADLSKAGDTVTPALSSVNAELKGTNLRDRDETLGDIDISAHSQGTGVAVSLQSSFAGSNTELRGTVGLVRDFPVRVDLSVKKLAVQKVLALVSRSQIPAAGSFNATGHIDGSLRTPQASLQFQVTNGSAYGQTVNRLEGSANYRNTLVELSSLQATTPAGDVQISGSFTHAASDLKDGRLQIHVSAAKLDVARIDYVRANRPGITGIIRLNGDAITDIRQMEILPVKIDANGSLTQVALNGVAVGSASFESHTTGQALSFDFHSDLAQSSVQGSGGINLQGDYPAKVQLSFSHLTYAGLKRLLPPEQSLPLDALVEGSASFNGPIASPDAATGGLQLTRLEVSSGKTTFQNQGALSLNLSHGRLSIQNAKIAGPSTNLALSGSIPLNKAAPIDLTVRADADLAVLKTMFPGSVSGGIVDVNASVRGALSSPALGGRIELSKASLQLADWPNGIYNANGSILLSGNGGQIQSLTGESGGGKVNVTGFFSLGEPAFSYNFHADARQVRTRYSGASVTANAALALSGTGGGGVLTGTVTVSRVGYGQQSDIGSILSAATKPAPPASAATGSLSAIRASVRIQTASDALFQTTLAQQLSATADLTLVGTLDNPGMIGRINITSGTLVFFSNKYTVDRGAISFYEASTIQPVLDIDLETIAQGVDVNLTVSGPIDNLKLTYRSDPPLKFEDILALLAAGKTPPDPTIAANQPVAPDQSTMQAGESALLGAAVANPITSRIQRVFGVSQFTVSPTFVSGTSLPQARVVLQQEVMQNVTFTYSQDLSQANAELVRIEWELTPRFSAIATRDEDGIFSVDFFWKTQFH